ncbi:hypothetical protein PFISCL1PPCAC_7729, partial [Pristionchus fissidentatus]
FRMHPNSFGLLLLLVYCVDAQFEHFSADHAVSLALPNGFPDGSLITFFFPHKPIFNPDKVMIDFLNYPTFKQNMIPYIPAHIKLNKYEKGAMNIKTNHFQKIWLDEMIYKGMKYKEEIYEAKATGEYWIHVDVRKTNGSISHICVQGECIEKPTGFAESLNVLRSAYLYGNIDVDETFIQLRIPSTEIPNDGAIEKGVLTYDNLPIHHSLDISLFARKDADSLKLTSVEEEGNQFVTINVRRPTVQLVFLI